MSLTIIEPPTALSVTAREQLFPIRFERRFCRRETIGKTLHHYAVRERAAQVDAVDRPAPSSNYVILRVSRTSLGRTSLDEFGPGAFISSALMQQAAVRLTLIKQLLQFNRLITTLGGHKRTSPDVPAMSAIPRKQTFTGVIRMSISAESVCKADAK